MDYQALTQKIKTWAHELGFEKAGITDIDLSEHEPYLQEWLAANYHGEMEWMARHGMMRAKPAELLAGTLRVISVRMNYLPPDAKFASHLKNKEYAYISRYALGRDYHKLVRSQLKKLGEKITQEVSTTNYRPFVDSAPILERPLAQKAGLGWVGKHSLTLDKSNGSWFFIGELLINIPLPVDSPSTDQCGKCTACITSCPTNAIIKEGVVDARRCISYLTIEYSGIIPEEFRALMGNRIYGCDDCQLVCPWNRWANLTQHDDFHRRDVFDTPKLVQLFQWTEPFFLSQMEGSPIRRIGHQQWLRNIAVALGNAPYSEKIIHALTERLKQSDLLDEHIIWAISQQQSKKMQSKDAKKNDTATESTKQQRLIRIIEKGLIRDA